MPKKLKIATMVSSEVPVPMPKNFPRAYATVPLAVEIANGMTRKGHKVSFFAPNDSKQQDYKLIKSGHVSLYKNKKINFYKLKSNSKNKLSNFFDQHLLGLIYEANKKEKFDIIHLHGPIDRCSFPLAELFPETQVCYTIHDPLTAGWRLFLHKKFKSKHQHLVSISNAQRKPGPSLNWAGTVYNGMDFSGYKFNPKPKDYLFYAGRILKRKGVYEAIQVAKATNHRLLIAGDYYSEKTYWETKIKPNLSKKIKYVGFISKDELMELYANAKASLMPIKWEEPFGLTFIESMAMGTPPISFDRGSAKEVIKHGKSGFVVKTLPQMIRAVKNIDKIDRKTCREYAEERFGVQRMVDEYEKVYYKVLKK